MSPTPPARSAARRDFLKASAWIAGSALVGARPASARVVPAAPAGRKLRIAGIGVGGKGESDIWAMRGEEVVALCDVDWNRAARSFERFPNARRYHDYRELFDRESALDAVVVSTPDHSHAVPALMAIERGLHVFCQKPLTHTVEEARLLAVAAKARGVCTQMGNQGTATDGMREAVEVIRAGTIGPVRRVHVWTNRPVWPQGIDRPEGVDPIPETLRWDLFLGPAPYRPYKGGYHPFAWRGWWDYGTGALGDMACHIMNLAFKSLRLGAPTRIEPLVVDGMREESA
ncbi:MAG: Gfo/Idh/MocA family protein, partial [Planctomycetota bacterium JB042]